ncbi:MAG: aminomethyl-transferring glycine dehydrogenase subunit GcvPB [Bacillota bacterium]|jgi:glycine dehydrogenase subunit 2|nr:aminomethyl-transferring glycine dehydrogenase subunit GcvPB [Bacillota bacterium]NLL26999.1 aminomethyl-transferring glycine dehydrogenase subunit GcvPB [Erysipelotrichia bacterium]
MKLLFEISSKDRKLDLIPPCDTEIYSFDDKLIRKEKLRLPEVSEVDLSRHYTNLAKEAHGVNNGFYPLGSCTMKYNPSINEVVASDKNFTSIHPLQPVETVQGCLEVLYEAKKLLCEITGMDDMSFQPAAGAHGEYAGLILIKKYHQDRNDYKRVNIIVPDSAHGTNPASATMVGFKVVNIPSNENGGVDIEKLKAAVGEDTAGLMLTNPNTLGLFDSNILEITRIVHDAGGLCYYDGANLNAIMGRVRPGDMGFDCVHLNLHKTFSTPHGGGGPGSGPVGCKDILKDFLPTLEVAKNENGFHFYQPAKTMGQVRSFYGNFLVVVKALTYIKSLGKEGIAEASGNAVLNANYLMNKLKTHYDVAYDLICMHEFVLSLGKMKREYGVSAMDIAKGCLDYGIHPPTMYFPLIVSEALMLEPTETESKETLDQAADIFIKLYETAISNPEKLHNAPSKCYITRPDEVQAARKPILTYQFKND